MINEIRSLNLSNSVAIVLYEALRRIILIICSFRDSFITIRGNKKNINDKRQVMNSLLCLFQCKNKFCSNTLCTDHIDVLSMCMKNLFDDCQTKAGSFLILASGSVNLIKSFPDFLETCLWNSNAMIFNRNKDLAVFSVVSSVIVELSGLNLIALLKRLYSTCWICSISACAISSFPDKISSRRILRLVQEPSKDAAVALITLLISKGWI